MNVLLVLGCVFVVVNARGYPPKIINFHGKDKPQRIVYVRSGNPMSFQCLADGQPLPQYYWKLNGKIITSDTSKVSFDSNNGTLRTGTKFGQDQSGEYQCFAQNEHGTAMSPFLKIYATVANTFQGSLQSSEEIHVELSQYIKLECKDVPLSVPPWKFSWERGELEDGSLVASPIVLGERMVIDKKGSLHILWTVESDYRHHYACSTTNDVLLVSVGNTKTILLSKPSSTSGSSGTSVDRPPELKYIEDVQVFAGEDAKLMCIYTYYSSNPRERMVIDWLFSGQVVGSGAELIIPEVQLPVDKDKTLEGEYMCRATLGSVTIEDKKVQLKIVAPPVFKAGKAPQAISVPVKQDAVFNCEATSHNSYAKDPVWLVNAVPLIGCPPREFECATKTDDGFSMCIPEKLVCDNNPDCPDDDSDEANCPGTCLELQKLCGLKCIPSASHCDESVCDFPGFVCKNEDMCLLPGKKCDGIKDCSDGSDENFCSDGEPIKRNRYFLSSDRTQLRLPSVSQAVCIQCMVTNDYGTVVGDGCLTVLDKIVVLRGPNSTYDVMPGSLLDITIEAVTERILQNQMKFHWKWYQEVEDKTTGTKKIVAQDLPPQGPFGRYFRLSQKAKNIVIQFPEVRDDDTDAYTIYNTMKDRVYTVVIEHSYDREEVNFTINGVEIVKPNKIVVLRGPNSTYDVMPGSLLDITIEAVTDRLLQNQMRFNWIWYQEVEDKKTGTKKIVAQDLPPPGPFGRYFNLSEKAKNMVIKFPEVRDDDTDSYTIYNTMKDRVYTVIIEHSDDRVEVNFTINGVEIVQPIEEAASTNLWYIALILAILVLCIVVALIVYYIYRKRGGTSPLDKNEQQTGLDPAQELKDSEFHDVGRGGDDYDGYKPKGDEAIRVRC